ncbi:glycosyltransferase family 1 protein [Solimonas sp. K1W22B-7]|uniref:glycosyltransferase family 4 protein n=1 Tax=Solimonas sp. K1W22B-7 TaxID=2303331 RepID=UPI000E337AC5|nr:glycosyltransferase family 4 protein [Solimonas sp. K1W22B-7]AXQ29916.1 glycosyltransferase family 1 protein [Solimonas sp. K1W22B-7]
MKVLHVLNGGIGGASLSTLDLIGGLVPYGVESFIYCSSRVSREAQEELRRRSPVPVYFGPMYFWNKRDRKPLLERPLIEAYQLAHTGALYRSSSRLMELCRELGIDLIHSSTALAPDGALAAMRLGLPHVWHIREMIGKGQLHRLAGDTVGLAARRFQRSGYVVANSHSAFRGLFGRDSAQGASVIHNGFDFGRFAAIREQPLEGDKIRFGLVANVSSTWKRHELFIRAAALVAARLPRAELSIFGEIPSETSSAEAREYYQSLVALCQELGLGERLSFRGYQDDVVQLMRSIDIVVHAAEFESFGRVFVEASAAGRGLVAVRGGASTEVIRDGETGLLVPPNEPEAMAAAMCELAQDPERTRRMGAAARQHVHEHFDIRRTCEKLAAIYGQQQRRPASGYVRSLARVMA